MKSYQNFTFQDRSAQSAKAKQEKLDLLRAKPPLDPAVQQARLLASENREAAQAERRAMRKAADEATRQATLDRKLAEEQAEAARQAAIKPVLTEAERKQARDARYAARKNRR
nr:DUF6481 family protein [uncultured Sphingomonas sp.]